MIRYKNKLVKILKLKQSPKNKSKEKKLMQIKRKNFEICKMLLEGNDIYKNKLVKIFKAKTKC